MTVTLTARARFSAAHRLLNPSWSDQKNWAVFGPCFNKNGHGHDYTVEVTVEGPVDPATGMILNVKDLKRLLDDEILVYVDHKNLNLDVPFLEGKNPTAETLALAFWEILEPKITAGRLHEIRVLETENNFASVRC